MDSSMITLLELIFCDDLIDIMRGVVFAFMFATSFGMLNLVIGFTIENAPGATLNEEALRR